MRKSNVPSYYRIVEQKAQWKPDHQTPTIRLMKFSYFRLLKEFPRYPDHANYTIPFTAIGEESREKSLFLFISHQWLRANEKCAGWSGRPHPDTVRNDVFKLCVKGIEQLLKSMITSSIIECYLWIDYCCLDQNQSIESDILNLDKVIEICDAVFTPIHDPDCDSWNYQSVTEPHFTMYQSPHWLSSVEDEKSYFNRAWCRLEMFFATNSSFKIRLTSTRLSRFQSELLYYLRQGKRPHFVYGTKEYVELAAPITLPPLSNEYLEQFSPENGFCTEDLDCEYIDVLSRKLFQLVEENRQLLMEADSKRSASESKGADGSKFLAPREEDEDNKLSFDRLLEAKRSYIDRSRSPSVYSDEFLFENHVDGDKDLNESMFGKGIYAVSFDD